MSKRIDYAQGKAIYEAAMDAAQDVPDGDPEASKAEAIAQIVYYVNDIIEAFEEQYEDKVNILRHALTELSTSYSATCYCDICKEKRDLVDRAMEETKPDV